MNEDEARQVLAVEANASLSELKAAYRTTVKLWHPDRFATDPASRSEASRQTQRINAAYHLLKRNVEAGGMRWSVAEEWSPDAWKRSPVRTRLIRKRLIVIVVSVVLYLGLSWFIHEVLLGF